MCTSASQNPLVPASLHLLSLSHVHHLILGNTPFDHALYALQEFLTLILPINPANLIIIQELLSVFHTQLLLI